MKKDFQLYLRAIGLPMQLDSRIDDILELYAEQLGGDAEDILISDYIAGGGTREYEALWLFSKKHVGEARNFMGLYNVDITPIEGCIKTVRLIKRAYDFEEATASSRLTIEFSTYFREFSQLKASGKNCDYLRDIMAKYLRPNMKQMVSAG